MKVLHSSFENKVDLPLQLFISFEKVFESIKKYTQPEYKTHPYFNAANQILESINKTPELIDGFSDIQLISKYKDQINLLLDNLFPEPLTLNEIKAASIPFSFTSFKFSKRFEKILDNAGKDYELKVRNIEEDDIYIMACSYILNAYYGVNSDLKRPFYFNIPDQNSGTMKYYRAAFNADFSEISATDHAPKLTDTDFKELLNNYNNIQLWRDKFPPNSYIFKGFGIINLFDVTAEEMISSIKANLLAEEDNLIERLQDNLRDFFGIEDLKLGYSIIHNLDSEVCDSIIKSNDSLILSKNEQMNCDCGFFCNTISEKVFLKKETFVISDVDMYGDTSNQNQLYQNLSSKGLKSIALIPIESKINGDLSLLEIGSPRPYELNSVNVNKLKDIIPVFATAVNRASEERKNNLEATIQEHYTSIHPSVKWRFYEAAEKYQAEKNSQKNIRLEEIVFKDVFPLYGQTDIVGSSIARNHAIREDLVAQLSLAISVLKSACSSEKLPIYSELMYRVRAYLKAVEKGLQAGDEINILEFLKREIYPVFNHIQKLNRTLKSKVDVYMGQLDQNLGVIYDKRKDYEESVMRINDKLALYLDEKQKDAQAMFPHYFERYKTDGVEYNLYIGQSITNSKTFNELYVHNLRLWQLNLTTELENIAFREREKLPYDLKVASLILVHGSPLSIKFRMDEKQFDVDGAYNIRYEILKKRIDKANIKGTNKRLTTPGKIAIVYSQESDAKEYMKYITFLQSKNKLGKVEYLDLEDVHGVSGLKSLRVEVIYNDKHEENKTITFDDLMQEIKA